MLWRKALIYWRSCLVIGAIIYVSLLREPSVALPPIEDIDKYLHGLMYILLTMVLLWDSKAVFGCRYGDEKYCLRSYKWWLIILVFPIVLGGFIEILQEKFFYPRTGDWLDWLADCVGVLMGVGLWIIGQKCYERRMAQ